MRKIALGLVVLVSLLFADLTQEEIREADKQCKNGKYEICYALGMSYFGGIGGFNKNYQEAKFYLEKVCKKGNEKDEYFAAACSNLGLLYYNDGDGVLQDLSKALKFYTLACDRGNAPACQNLGVMYSNGEGVSQDTVKGAGYFRRACDAGSWAACGAFAFYHYNSGNQSKAAQYFKKACELGRNDYDVKNDPKARETWQGVCNTSDALN